jgi:acyl-CoA hydrolase
MEVTVNAYAENPKTGATIHTNCAYLTFVALDEEGKPSPVPGLNLESDEEREAFHAAKKRREERISKKTV